MSLPDQLDHESVTESRTRSEPKFDCYQVVLDEPSVPFDYRPQWKDDWEILNATIEDRAGGQCLRLTLIERYEDPYWRRMAMGATAAAAAVSYLSIGGWLQSTGVIGSTAVFYGTVVVALGLLPMALMVVDTLRREYTGELDAARP